MNTASLAASYLRARPLQTALSLLLLALGAGTIVTLLLVVGQLEGRMGRDARGIDLVVGAKGSPMQLILSGIYHADAPTGNMPARHGRRCCRRTGWSRRRCRSPSATAGRATASSAPARSTSSTTARSLPPEGSTRRTMEAVLGYEVAARTGVGVGGKFAGAHGIGGDGDEHGATPYTVVGVLARSDSVLDRLVLTGIESVWHVHEEHQGPAGRAGPQGDGGGPRGHGGPGAVRLAARRGHAAAADQREERAAGGFARLRDGAPVPHGRRRRRGAARLRRWC